MRLPLIIAFLLTMPLWHATAWAQSQDDPPSEEQLRTIQQQLEENARTAAEIEAARKQREAELIGLRARLIETADSLKAAERDATELEKRIADLSADEAIARGSLATKQQHLSEMLAALQSLEIARPPALAVSPDDAAEAARAAMALSTAAPLLAAQADSLRAQIDRLSAMQKRLDEQKNDLRRVERELDARRQVLENLLTRKEQENALAKRRAEALYAENKRLEQRASNIRELLEEIERSPQMAETTPIPQRSPLNLPDNDRGESPLDRRPSLEVYANLPGKFSAARGMLPLPVTGQTSATYGKVAADGAKLEGVRIRTRSGAVVTAPFSGAVAFAGQIGRLGNISLLDVGEGFHLVFIGLGQLEVKKGDQISAGEVIGYMPEGQTRPELEFQVRKNQLPQNPKKWLQPTG